MLRILIPLFILLFALCGCSTTERIPEGEQLYLGIKKIKYVKGEEEITKIEKEKGDSTGIITDVANAYTTVKNVINGTQTTMGAIHELSQKKRSELTREEKRTLALHEMAEAEALSTAKSEVSAALAYEPNGSLFGSSTYTFPLKFGLRVYNKYAETEKGFGHWMFKKFAENPILISTVAPQTRAKIATNTLHNYGFFRGNVDYDIVETKNPKASRVSYNITTGPVFHLDSIEYRSFGTMADSLLVASRNKCLLKSGEAFSVLNLTGEQERIENLMRENGYYYWSSNLTTFQADTIAVPGYVQMRVLPKPNIPANAQHPWYIGQTYVIMRTQHTADVTEPLDHTRSRRGYTYTWSGETMPLKGRIWRTAINHRKGELFRVSDQTATITKLSALGILSAMDVSYTPRDTTATCDTLDVYVQATMAKPYDSSFEVNAILKSSQQIGPGVKYELAKHNAFHAGETVSWNIFGSYEWQFGRHRNGGNSLLNSFELGSSANLELPRFYFPFVSKRRLRFPATTKFSLSADWKNRSGFFQMLDFGGNVTYSWQPREGSVKYHNKIRHEWTLFDLSYYKLINTSAAFDSIRTANPAIYASMRNVYVPSMSYSFTYSSPLTWKNPIWFQWTAKESGNLTDGIHCIFYPHHPAGEPRKLFGSNFAQFLKTTAEVHYLHTLNERLKLATRAFAGVIFNYGGNEAAPYAEQFYIGGANSIRAFTVRTAGPGAYRAPNSKYAYIDQTGDFKLEANAELRAHLFGSLHGAIFLDAGNVWLMKKDELRPDAELTLSNLRRIALGSGAGIRYDLGFLVLRFDVGIGLHAPYETSRSGFYNFERFRDGVAYHFAIGYPF